MEYFSDSLVNNIVDLCALLPRLNIADDPRLEEMRQTVESTLCQANPEVLRDNIAVRATTASNAETILSAMAGYMGA